MDEPQPMSAGVYRLANWGILIVEETKAAIAIV
jgi:hypothetical protein